MATRRVEKQAQTRARLLDAAQAVFAERGFFAASVDEIAGRAGFTMGAVYSNFATKADLFLALFEEQIATQLPEYVGAADAREGAARWMRHLRDRPDYFPLFLEFAAYAAREPEVRRRLATRLGAFHDAFARMVADAAAERGVALAPQAAATAGVVVNALANGLALAKLADPDAVPDELFGGVLALLLEGLTHA